MTVFCVHSYGVKNALILLITKHKKSRLSVKDVSQVCGAKHPLPGVCFYDILSQEEEDELSGNEGTKVLSTKDGKMVILDDSKNSVSIVYSNGTNIALNDIGIQINSAGMRNVTASGNANISAEGALNIIADDVTGWDKGGTGWFSEGALKTISFFIRFCIGWNTRTNGYKGYCAKAILFQYKGRHICSESP